MELKGMIVTADVMNYPKETGTVMVKRLIYEESLQNVHFMFVERSLEFEYTMNKESYGFLIV